LSAEADNTTERSEARSCGFNRRDRPQAGRFIRPLTLASVPLLVLVLGDVILRFAGVT